MEMWQENHREEIVMVDMEQLVPKDHLLRKVEKIMDYKWLYERLSPLYCHDNGRNGTAYCARPFPFRRREAPISATRAIP